jgi:hypothetical protein
LSIRFGRAVSRASLSRPNGANGSNCRKSAGSMESGPFGGGGLPLARRMFP